MDLTCTNNPTPTPSHTPTKTPDSEIDTPPLIKPLSFTNFTFKNHHHNHNHNHNHPPPCAPPSSTAVTYKECLKNHAASIGGHAVDGCGEFIASPESTQSNPISLSCAACGCHRNFHRREPSENQDFISFRHHILPPIHHFSPSSSPSSSPSPPPPLPQPQPQPIKAEKPCGRKRFRTKFTQEQKEKMHLFSEKLGWKLQKVDEVAVDEFCREVGVGKGVLRVWMHNNKNTFGKKEHSFENKNGFNMNGGTSSNEDNHRHNDNNNDNNDNSTSNCELHLHISTNGSSSSS
ncbi:Zinc-finger homeodomain protein 11 [Capsicum chinense]|nr:Zinc-finger homeodomain protein 11 [Capsicum chinense]